MEKQQYIEAGKIINTHGVAGEVKIEVWLDSPEFFKKFKRIFINGREYPVESYKTNKDFIIAKLKGIDNINDAMKYKEHTVCIDRGDVKLPKNSFYICDLIGAKVINDDGTEIGTLEEVIENPTQLIYVVKGEQEHLIPAVPEFVLSINGDEGVIRVKLIDGM